MNQPQLPAAAIFDMDGVLVDSNPFHLQKWMDLLRARGIPFSADELPRQILGHRNDHAFRLFFGTEITREEIEQLSEELENIFRESFGPHARPLPGLETLLGELETAGIPMAVASSAMRPNIEFVVEKLGFQRFFPYRISGDDVKTPKPDPEIYLAAARMLSVDPTGCVGFEDSFAGIEAVKRAGMKCVAIASTFAMDDLRAETRADRVVRSFEDLSVEKLRALFSE
jgi:beta-phosphoglucomutase